eukprot:2621224-Alexandrium_andersonii.AAC.1
MAKWKQLDHDAEACLPGLRSEGTKAAVTYFPKQMVRVRWKLGAGHAPRAGTAPLGAFLAM